MKILVGDNVKILIGKDKGKTGKVSQVFPKFSKVVVEGLNMATKHLRKRGDQAGKKIEYASPIHISNVSIVRKDGSAGRVGYKMTEKNGKTTKLRVTRKAGAVEEV
jgi:large subunit ribosomal protein L24